MPGENNVPDSSDNIRFKRDHDFGSLYANNVRLEMSVWDLKLIFGVLDQSNPREQFVEQHTAISLPWPIAKIVAYHMLVNILIQQAQCGQIWLRPDVIPPRPDSSSPDIQPNDKPVAEYLAWIHDQFFGPNPYVPPSVAAMQNPPKAE